MNINKQYAWQSNNNNSRENSLLLPRNVRGPIIGRVDVGRQQTKQVAEKTAEELVHVKKALEDIDGALKAQQHTIVVPPSPPSPPQKDLKFGIHTTGDGRYVMRNSIVHI